MKIDENSEYRQRNSSYLLNDLRNFNEICRKDVPYDNIKSHKKPGFPPVFRRYIFRKTTGEGVKWPSPPFLSCLRVKGKAAGLDGIPPEVFMFADIDDIILKFANNLLLNLEKPAQWSTSHIQPIPKTGELSEFGTYRGIALSPVAAKVTNKMLLNPIQPIWHPLLRPNENGFRPGRSTTNHVLALRRIIEGVKSHKLQAAIIFVDFKKAFDSIHRHKGLEILRKYGVRRKLVDAIGKLWQHFCQCFITWRRNWPVSNSSWRITRRHLSSFPLCIGRGLCNEAS